MEAPKNNPQIEMEIWTHIANLESKQPAEISKEQEVFNSAITYFAQQIMEATKRGECQYTLPWMRSIRVDTANGIYFKQNRKHLCDKIRSALDRTFGEGVVVKDYLEDHGEFAEGYNLIFQWSKEKPSILEPYYYNLLELDPNTTSRAELRMWGCLAGEKVEDPDDSRYLMEMSTMAISGRQERIYKSKDVRELYIKVIRKYVIEIKEAARRNEFTFEQRYSDGLSSESKEGQFYRMHAEGVRKKIEISLRRRIDPKLKVKEIKREGNDTFADSYCFKFSWNKGCESLKEIYSQFLKLTPEATSVAELKMWACLADVPTAYSLDFTDMILHPNRKRFSVEDVKLVYEQTVERLSEAIVKGISEGCKKFEQTHLASFVEGTEEANFFGSNAEAICDKLQVSLCAKLGKNIVVSSVFNEGTEDWKGNYKLTVIIKD